MVEPAGKILEGVFAITKPPSLSSAQVLRDLQHAFKSSDTFRPLLNSTSELESKEKHRSKRRRIDNDNVFKMGHGGTLDPMATGVLIVGIGRGTKSLQDFLYCTKTYETVVLFGKSTDTYDVAGKVVASAPTGQITKEVVEGKLSAFRGKIKQTPPIYSALKIDGMKAYEYARSGKELPRQLEAREMEVSECVLTEWYEPGKHAYRWPAQEATEEDKRTFQQLTKIGHADLPEPSTVGKENAAAVNPSAGDVSATKASSTVGEQIPLREEKAALHVHNISGLSESVADAPAAKIRLTVSSGFYVRSFAHDLGILCGSFGTMSELARTRQAAFTSMTPIPDGLIPALEYADIEKDEGVWGPKITKTLEDWLVKNPAPNSTFAQQRKPSAHQDAKGRDWRGKDDGRRDYKPLGQRRRNSSSPE